MAGVFQLFRARGKRNSVENLDLLVWAGRLAAEFDFAAAHELVVDPQAVLVAAGFGAGAWRAGLQAHAGGSVENIGGKRATVHVELDAQITSVADPGDLIAGIEDDYFGEYTNENGAF